MTFPAELKLRTVGGVPTLCASPAREIKKLFTEGPAAAYYAELTVSVSSPGAALNICGSEIPLQFDGTHRVEVILDRNGWELYLPDFGRYWVGGVPSGSAYIEYSCEDISARGASIKNAELYRLRSVLPAPRA